jgi:hypothetical protein
MVRDNKADFFIGNLATLDRAIQSRYVGQLKVVGATEARQLIGFDVRPGLEPLVPLIDRAIEAMPPEERLAVRNRYLTTNYQFGLSRSEVRRRAAPYVALVITALALWLSATGVSGGRSPSACRPSANSSGPIDWPRRRAQPSRYSWRG